MKALLAHLRRLEKKKGKQKGFTLIELMIVVAIIGILAAVAIPAYSDYTAKAQVSEAFALSASAKQAVALYRAEKGDFPTTNALAGLDASAEIVGAYVSGVAVGTGGAITATFSVGTAGTKTGDTAVTVTLTPDDTTNTGSITWACTGTVKDKYLPTDCTGAA
jgi:type IV pilus assembly protein PilA